jgi:serine/threonine protein kinase/WD40 repeat protein
MDSSTSDRNPFDRLAEEFALRVRRGERPPLSEYTARYPELADEIRRAFPAIVMMERLKPDSAELRGPDPARATSGRRAIPDRLGDYRILRFISEGGMGYVFEAVQESMGRRVALKVLKPEIVGQRQLARFLRESRAPGRLHHTNIVPIFGIGECDDLHYYAMQFIYGESLEKVIADLRHLRDGRCGPAPATGDAPPLPTPATLSRSLRTGRFADTDPDLESGPTAKNGAVAPPASLAVPDRQPEAGGRASAPSSTSRPGLEQPSGRIFYKSVARIGEQVALAMGHAHRNGVLHRDIKPANLLLDLQGTVWVADFGLAHEADAEDLSRGDVVGTLRFIPPERFRGESLPQGDIYSLGLTLYELATLEPAFRGPDTRHLMHLIQHGHPRTPRTVDGEIPRDLETIILKAIDKDPRRRYATADAMAEDLLAFREDREIRSRRARWPERLVRWCRRNPAVAGLSGLALLLLSTIAVVLAVSAARLHREALRAQGAEGDALERLFRASFARARASRGRGRMGQRHDTLSALTEAAALSGRVAASRADILEMRDEAIAAMALPDVRLGHEWEGNPPGTNGRAFDSNYKRYALSKRDGEVTVHRVADDRGLRNFAVIPGEGLNRTVQLGFGPGDRHLAAAYLDTAAGLAFIWDLEDQGGRPLVSVRSASSAWSFSESRRIAAIGTNDRRVRRFDLTAGRELTALDVGILPSAVAVQPGGRVLAVAALEPPAVHLFDFESGRLLNTLLHAPADERPGAEAFHGVEGLAWHPDGELLATACDDHKIYIWDWLSGRRRIALTGHNWEVAHVTFSHSGNLLASYGHDKTVRLWDHRAGNLLLTVPGSRWIGFSRDDRTFTARVEGRHVALCHLDMPDEYRFTEGHHDHHARDDVAEVRFHPQGRLFATTARHDGVRLWDLVNGQEVAHISTAAAIDVLFEKSGTGLLTYDSSRLRRWPLELSSREGHLRVRIGPPERLMTLDDAPPCGRMAFCGPDQERLAIMDDLRGVNLIDLVPSPRVVQSWRSPRAAFIAASPDGRWVATGSWEGPGFQVWDTRHNVLARLWNTGDADVAFSPDGRWLASGYGVGVSTEAECTLWRVGSWERGPSIALERTTSPSFLAYSDDGRMLAMQQTMTEVLLADARDLRELAHLKSPAPTIVGFMRFSPDGGSLVAGTAAGSIHVWDLRRIRARLKEMHLDWDLPPIGPSPSTVAAAHPLDAELRLDPSSLVARARYFLEIQNYRRAVADFEAALALDPGRPDARRGLVGVLTNGPTAMRHLVRASDLLRTALDRGAANPADRGDLGMVLYRQARYAEAVEALESALGGQPDAADRTRWRIFLAMSQNHLGRSQAARESYRRARSELADIGLSPTSAGDLARIGAEADADLHGADGGR